MGRWDLATPSYQPGSWFHGVIPPQKCDLSPDGRWFLYSAVKYPRRWEGGAVYEAVSRLPWLTALAAWDAGTTYTRGLHFTQEAGHNDAGEPDMGELGPLLRGFGLAVTRPGQFAVERRRGWIEAPETLPRLPSDVWDVQREVEMVKRRPGDGVTLHVLGAYAAHREFPEWHDGVLYYLAHRDRQEELDAQWADWAPDGRLLVATRRGRLQIRAVNGTVEFDHDLSDAKPDPQPPPEEARRW